MIDQIRINANTITQRESFSFERYLQEISTFPLLTPEEEVALGKLILKGDEDAVWKLVRANLRFVVSVAKKYQSHGIPLPDLVQVGNLGLIKAAYRFDWTKGFKFISYAVWWIRQPMLQEIAERSRIVRMPLNRASELAKITKKEIELQQAKRRKISLAEVADSLGIELEEVQNTKQLAAPHMSLDNPFSDSESSTLLDVLPNDSAPPDQSLEDEARTEQINAILSEVLSARDANIFRMYHGLAGHVKMTFEEIGAALTPSITRERVRQLVDKSTKLLRTDEVKKRLRVFI